MGITGPYDSKKPQSKFAFLLAYPIFALYGWAMIYVTFWIYPYTGFAKQKELFADLYWGPLFYGFLMIAFTILVRWGCLKKGYHQLAKGFMHCIILAIVFTILVIFSW